MRPSPTPASRFAPSPSGLLHKGHALSALMAAKVAHETGGRFVLRIEDIDTERCRPEFEAAIIQDLTWLGLDWDRPVRRQSEHLQDYADALERLRARGLVYRCFKTRGDILGEIGRAPHETPPIYVGAPLSADEEAAKLAQEAPYAWRLSLAAARAALGGDWGRLTFTEQGAGPRGEHGVQIARPERVGDVILARKGLGVAYHLAVVVDDALQGITDVVRGEDLFEAVHVQRLLQALLDLPAPVYHHHRLLVGSDGKRLAKRDKAETLQAIRERGVTADALREELGFG